MGVLPRVEERATGTNRMTLLPGGRAASRPGGPLQDLQRHLRPARRDHARRPERDLLRRHPRRRRVRLRRLDHRDLARRRGAVRERPRRAGSTSSSARTGCTPTCAASSSATSRASATSSAPTSAVLTLPNYLGLDGEMPSHVGVGRIAGMYGARHLDDARALFLFRTRARARLPPPRRAPAEGTAARRVRAACAPTWTAGCDELDRTPAFYFDSITQLRMDTWSRGRVTLVGDAGYCPGPAVGGSTSLAVVGAYILAGELAGRAATTSAPSPPTRRDGRARAAQPRVRGRGWPSGSCPPAGRRRGRSPPA